VRIKSTLSEGVPLRRNPEDINKWVDDLKDRQEAYRKKQKEEALRLEKLSCPVCKQTEKEHKIRAESNGIMGPGHFSRVVEDYWICKSCGVHFTDINKPDLGEYPRDITFLR